MKKYNEFINEEVGLRNLTKILKGKKTAEIYFHKDLDGVTSAIAMKTFIKNYYQVETVDCHVIQYGGLEYAVKHAKPGNVPILVDFAHSKPMFTIATDHHDSQVGASDTDSTYFKSARSNVETISGEISHSDIFTSTDIKMIQTIDSADFLANDIKPEDVQNSIFKHEKSESATKNRYMMGFVVNRLLLAYKNKRITVKSLDGKNNHINKNILECLTLDSTASLYSMFNNIRHYINNAKTTDKLGRLATPEEIKKNLTNYIDRMKDYTFVEMQDGEVMELSRTELALLKIIDGKPSHMDGDLAKRVGVTTDEYVKYIDKLLDKNYISNDHNKYKITWFGRKALIAKKTMKGIHMDEEYKILIQYGGGNMMKPGSYDRYTPFKNFPESEFLCIVWPMGLIQVSVNPFKEKKLKNINLGEISKEVLAKHEEMLKKYYISLEDIKSESENSQDWKQMARNEDGFEGVGFKFSDLEAFYHDCVYKKEGREIVNVDIKTGSIENDMNTLHKDLSDDQKNNLNNLKVPAWELIIRNSGGHPSITNISGLSYLKYNKKMMRIVYDTDKYTDVIKKISRDFVDTLKTKIDDSNSGKEIEYNTKGVQLLGQDTNENFEYLLSNDEGETKTVSKEEFVEAGHEKGMKTDNMFIDTENRRIIANFDKFNYKG